MSSRVLPEKWRANRQTRQTSATMVYATTSVAYVTVLLALGASRSEAFVPSSSSAASLAKRSTAVTAWRTPATRCCRSRKASRRSRPNMSTSDEHDILLRVAKGEKADRAPVWLMRQVSVCVGKLEGSCVLQTARVLVQRKRAALARGRRSCVCCACREYPLPAFSDRAFLWFESLISTPPFTTGVYIYSV